MISNILKFLFPILLVILIFFSGFKVWQKFIAPRFATTEVVNQAEESEIKEEKKEIEETEPEEVEESETPADIPEEVLLASQEMRESENTDTPDASDFESQEEEEEEEEEEELKADSEEEKELFEVVSDAETDTEIEGATEEADFEIVEEEVEEVEEELASEQVSELARDDKDKLETAELGEIEEVSEMELLSLEETENEDMKEEGEETTEVPDYEVVEEELEEIADFEEIEEIPAVETEMQEKPPSELFSVRVKIAGENFWLEHANTEEKRTLGLMNRSSIPENQGMLFSFPGEEIYGFWMKNTLIPLDLIWLDSDFRVVDFQTLVPCLPSQKCPSTYPSGKAKYVIEMNAGVFKGSIGEVLKLEFLGAKE